MPRKSNDNENKDREQTTNNRVNITRRDALVGTLAAGVAKSIGAGNAVAQEEIGIELGDGVFEDEQNVYRQYSEGELDDFSLSGETEVSIDYDEMNDDYIVAEVALKINHNDYEVFGQDRDDNISDSNDGGTVRFTAEDLWDGGAFDFEQLDQIEEDYANLNVEDHTEKLAVNTSVSLRFRFVSSQGSLSEEEILHFEMNIGVPLGFGQYFGQNFGYNHVESWPTDWQEA